MHNQKNKNHLLILVIFGMSVIPFLIAWGLKEHPQLLNGQTNHGRLITPPLTTERSDLTGFDSFSAENMSELAGHWLLVNVIPESNCNDVCIEALHKTKQLRLMLNKELPRTRRIVLILKDIAPEIAASWWADDKTLIRVKPNDAVIKKLADIRQGNIPHGMLLLMDPLGNVMMQYEPGFDPYDVKSDLMHLLRISQIG
ncbi:MAG: hypothetical protein U1D70_17915 [Methylobacter sp.]|nr:hypothetical protein [Methylobacter sp.]MDP2427520.1 hypothetical protein [Methylobacter sp.]MDP3056805.1 hypothetical protein [Methylobacter sp.]MDP3364024.1 hypothetical protein [Methylobacter sp.]MDZ4220887.1 hypothetical protein [Methylobacter sp.]